MEDKLYQNYVSCYMGLSYIGKALLPYTESVLKKVFQGIYQQLAGLPPCTTRCSETYGNSTKRWCITCKKWKNMLQNTISRRETINWQRSKSWMWPKSMDNIKDVFMPSWYDVDIDLRDIGTVSSVWKQCKAFRVNRIIYDRVCQLRNKYVAHNPDLEVSDLDKSKLFDALTELINDPDVKKNIDFLECYNGLLRMETPEDKYMAMLKSIFDKTEKNARDEKECMKKLGERVDKCDNSHATFKQLMEQKINHRRGGIAISLTNVLLVVIVYLNFLTIKHDISATIPWNLLSNEGQYFGEKSIEPDCFSETFTYPFPQDLLLLPYVSDHKHLIGREWLFQEIAQYALQSNNSKRGLVIVAEMGYGKTAMVSHMLCSNKDDTRAWYLRQHITAFHICKFDVSSTRRPGRFIRRLVGFFSKQNVEFGTIISFLEDSSLIFDDEKCNKEPEACFDQGVIFPLKKVKPERPWLIVIDALDECFEHDTNKNHIADLLKGRLKRFPSWVHFLILSRNTEDINAIKHVTVLHLNTSDPRNLKDIEDYLDSHKSFTERVHDILGKKSKTELLKEIITESEGNFLFITYSLEEIVNRYLGAKVSIPLTLTDFYESNFERQFQTETDFRIAKSILQVICASLNPLRKPEIIMILHANEVTEDKLIDTSFDKLSFFLRINSDVTFIHQSIHDWLISTDNRLYHILPAKGHVYLSHYLMKKAKANHALDLVEMAIHVGNSNEESLRKIFKSLKHEYFINVADNSLHRLINLTDSDVALELLLPFVPGGFDSIDNGASPAFLAAMNGHIDQLKLLFKKGSDINWVLKDCTVYAPGEVLLQTIFKHNEIVKASFCEFSLLHIATVKSHSEVVRYLLQANSSLINVRNRAGQLASDIACEYGFIDILKQMTALKHDIVGEYCAYLAARNGHVVIIEYLLKSHLKCDCISAASSLLSFNSVGKTSDNTYSLLPLDEWWRVFMESALHVAVRKGHSVVVSKISKFCPSMLNCKDIFGRTPFLASIWYNRIDIFKTLSFRMNDANEICSHSSLPSSLQHLTVLHELMLTKKCPDGFTIAHLFAKYDRLEMLIYTIRNRLLSNWSLLDKDGYPPEHYAACSESCVYLYLLVRGTIPVNITTQRYKNGMTVYHSAALCRSLISLSCLQDSDTRIPHFEEDREQGILIYTVLSRLEASISVYPKSRLEVVYFLTKYGNSVLQTDSDGKNILHYSFLYNDVSLLNHIFNENTSVLFTLLNQKDVNGFTPVEQSLLNNMNKTMFKLPQNCKFYNIYTCQDVALNDFMSPWESILIQTMSLASKGGSMITLPTYLIPSIFMFSPYITTALFTFCNNTDHDLRRQLHRTMRLNMPPSHVLKYSLISIARHKSNILHACYQTFQNSPLHQIMYFNYINTDWVLQVDDIVDILSLILENHRNPNCPNSRGFNIFHYALMGGGIHLGEQMIRSGFVPINKRVRHVDIIWMVLLSRFNTNVIYTDCTDNTYRYIGLKENHNRITQIYCSDTFLSDFINLNWLNLTTSDFCLNNTKELSLIHLLSLNGMLKSLRVIRDNYGQDALFCSSKDGFTPHYMWRLYNKHVYWNALVKSFPVMNIPNAVAEELLFYKLGHVFLDFQATDPLKCLAEIRPIHWRMGNIRNKYRIKQCIENASALVQMSIGTLIDDRDVKEVHLISRITHFFENVLSFEVILENVVLYCIVLEDLIKRHNQIKRFILTHEELFSLKKGVVRNLQYTFLSFKNAHVCQLSFNDIWRIKTLRRITNHLISVMIPEIINICFKHVLANKMRYPKKGWSHFLKQRWSNVHQSFIKQKRVNLMRIYHDSKYLDIIKKTLFYQSYMKSNHKD